MIYQNDLYVETYHESGRRLLLCDCIYLKMVREFTVPLTAVTSKEELRKTVYHGIAVPKMDDNGIYNYMGNQLQAKSVAEEARRQFGWTMMNAGFVLVTKR